MPGTYQTIAKAHSFLNSLQVPDPQNFKCPRVHSQFPAHTQPTGNAQGSLSSGYRFLFTGTSLRCGGSSSAQTHPAFFSCIICRQGTEIFPEAGGNAQGTSQQWQIPTASAGRKHHLGQAGQPPAGQTPLWCCSSHFCLPPIAGLHTSFTLLFKLPLLFVCFEAPKVSR